MQEEATYSVQKILQEEIIEGKPHYLIKWQGFPATESTWEPIQNLMETIDDVYKWKKQQQRPKMRRRHINRKHEQSSYERNRYNNYNQQLECDIKNREVPLPETESSPIYNWKKRRLNINQQSSIERSKYQNRPIKNIDLLSKSQQMEGFKAVGRISKSQISQVLRCFNWQSKQLCEIQLTNQRKVYMLKSDVERLYPEKLCKDLQQMINTSQPES